MNFYDVLAAKNWDGCIPTINFFDLLFAQSMGGSEQWETYEGTLPATINANGDDMRQYRIYGNTGGVGTWDDTEQSYKLDMSVSDGTTSTTTPIYIGDEPLDKDEYVDYATQKVYHMMDGTLTPTDPPVALPALPTCDGETVVSYAGESVAPEKVVFEYKKGGN